MNFRNTFLKIIKKARVREGSYYFPIPKPYIDMGFIDPNKVEIHVKIKPNNVNFIYWDKSVSYDLEEFTRAREARRNPIPYEHTENVNI